jgi:hypothetical protein
MSRKIIIETGYTFTPSSRTVVIPKYIPRERLVLITNVTTNQVIYNFSDPSLRATSYTATVAQGTQVETTTLVLNYNTALMTSTDKLQITIDDYVEKFEPAETLLDPTNKLRVTEPQALIDTDFEYGTQITKWENLSTTNQRPAAYQPTVGIPNITGIAMSTGSRTVTVTTSAAHGLTIGTPITVIDTYLITANGNYVVDSVPSATTFTYTGSSQNATSMTAIFDANKTIVTQNAFYTNALIGGAAPSNVTYSGAAVTVTFAQPHGLMVGNEITVTGITTSGANPPNGAFFVSTVTSPTVFVYYYFAATISGTLSFGSAAVYPRPQGSVVHRPFDGGVLFTNGAGSPNQMTARQTRRYFRYQSGKGIQASSGTILKPNFQIDALTSSGTTVTVQTKERHGLQPGAVIVVTGANETAYNGTFTISAAQIVSSTKFQYTAGSTPSATPASGNYSAAISSWYGATNRLGIFDQQNGMFWEFDGQVLSAVRRSSTYQIAGRVTVTAGSATVSQTDANFPTVFSKQLTVGDSIVLRGQTYRVTAIASDTSLTINPTYRGITSGMVVASKTIDTKVAQSAFNIDKLDGTGPSGYNIDLTKMQMFYIDYTWYGAGFIRFGVRGPQGNIIYCHKIPNNNVNTEAYMRSGNLPARYESATMAPTTVSSAASIGSGDTTLNVASNTAFPPAGTLCIRQGNQIEYVNYTAKNGTTQFTGVTRAQAGAASQTFTIASGATSGTVAANTGIQIGQRVIADAIPEDTFVTAISGTTITISQAATAANPSVIFAPMAGAAQAFTYSATNPIAVELAIPQFGTAINHWGTSVIMDGKFDDDKSLVFTYGQTAFTNIPAATTTSATTATGSVGAFTFAVASASGILPGMTAIASGIPTGSIVTLVSGLNITINQPIATALSSTSITFNGGNSKALMSIRVSPSVDNGVTGTFGARELVNRIQLTLKSLGISTKTANANMLVRAYLNGTPNGTTAWTNAVGNAAGAVNSSLGQIADYAGGSTVVFGGETTAGFFVSGTDRLDLTDVRDLGNSILGGGTTTSNAQIYPDGPDVLTVVVTNLGAAAIDVLGRLSWTEAQA